MLITKTFNIGIITPSTNKYFIKLATSIIEARKQDSEPTIDFLQTLTDNMIDDSKPKTKDENARSQTEKGKIKVDCLKAYK